MEIQSLIGKTEEYLRQFDSVSVPRGGMTPNDLAELDALIRLEKKNNITIADIGVWTGQGTAILANIVKDVGGKVYAIDWFKGSENSNLAGVAKYINVKNIFQDGLVSHGLSKWVEIVDKTSKEASYQFADSTFDFIFLDADHRYRYVKEDIELWLPKLKSGGILFGHDCEFVIKNMDELIKYNENKDVIGVMHFGVCKAVGELGGTKCSENTSLWYYKKS